MSDAGIAIRESKYYYQYWRPVTGIREADQGTGQTGAGDGNPSTVGDPNFLPLGAQASNINGPNFMPPFPAYPSGHAGFGGALFQILRNFYETDKIAFTFVSDEFNGMTLDNQGIVPNWLSVVSLHSHKPRKKTVRAEFTWVSSGRSTRLRVLLRVEK